MNEMPAASATVPDDSLVYDTRDLCRLLKTGSRTIWRWSNSGVMPRPSRVGGRVLWPAATIREWIARGMPRVNGNGVAGKS